MIKQFHLAQIQIYKIINQLQIGLEHALFSEYDYFKCIALIKILP